MRNKYKIQHLKQFCVKYAVFALIDYFTVFNAYYYIVDQNVTHTNNELNR